MLFNPMYNTATVQSKMILFVIAITQAINPGTEILPVIKNSLIFGKEHSRKRDSLPHTTSKNALFYGKSTQGTKIEKLFTPKPPISEKLCIYKPLNFK